jgi:nucleoid-associated protein YgaU
LPSSAAKTEASAKNSNPRFHTVAIGDTLSKISLQYYGTTARWTDILAANRDLLRDERSLVAGRILRIP